MMMKCIEASAFGRVDDVLSLNVNRPLPKLQACQGDLLIKVGACGLTPGDIRMIDGSARVMRVPKFGFPYIPGGDVCGEVVEADDDSEFKKGDEIIASWDIMGVGGMAEYAIVSSSLAITKPQNASYIQGAVLANSPVYAMLGIERAKIKTGDRVLILGGSGALGTALVQMARNAGATYIAVTSTDEPLLKSLGADAVINYRKEKNWWEASNLFQNQSKILTSENAAAGEGASLTAAAKHELFDVVFDCAVGVEAWRHGRHVVKTGWRGGRWCAFVLQKWHIEAVQWTDLFVLLLPPLWRQTWSYLCQFFVPSYKMMLGGHNKQAMQRLSDLYQAGKFRVVLHKDRAFHFTEMEAKEAFRLQENRAGHGNIVVDVSQQGGAVSTHHGSEEKN